MSDKIKAALAWTFIGLFVSFGFYLAIKSDFKRPGTETETPTKIFLDRNWDDLRHRCEVIGLDFTEDKIAFLCGNKPLTFSLSAVAEYEKKRQKESAAQQ